MARKRKSQVAKVRDFLFTGKKLTAKTAINRFGIYRLEDLSILIIVKDMLHTHYLLSR